MPRVLQDLTTGSTKKFEIDELRCIYCGMCEEACPVDAIELTTEYDIVGRSRQEMIFDKEKLLSLGGTHAGIQKWRHKLEEAKAQEAFPVENRPAAH